MGVFVTYIYKMLYIFREIPDFDLRFFYRYYNRVIGPLLLTPPRQLHRYAAIRLFWMSFDVTLY